MLRKQRNHEEFDLHFKKDVTGCLTPATSRFYGSFIFPAAERSILLSELLLELLDGDLRRALGHVRQHNLHAVLARDEVGALRTLAEEMDRVEIAARGADAAADALVRVHHGGTAAEAAAGLEPDLLLGERAVRVGKGLLRCLAGVEGGLLTLRLFHLFRRERNVCLVQLNVIFNFGQNVLRSSFGIHMELGENSFTTRLLPFFQALPSAFLMSIFCQESESFLHRAIVQYSII